MRRVAVLFALAACNEAAPPLDASHSSANRLVYPPANAAWPLGAPTGTIGRSQAPQPALAEGVVGSRVAWRDAGALLPLRMPTPWTAPGDGPARAVIYGLDGDRHAVELIDIDAGIVQWRDTRGCAAPVVGVTAEAVVCADAKGIRAIAIADGKPRWKADATFIAMTDDRVITAGAGESVILDASNGDDIAHVKLPPGVMSDSIIASCGDGGRELFAYGQDGQLVHIVEAQGGPKAQWSVPLETIANIDACEGDSVLVTTTTEKATSLVALARATGKVTGSIDGMRSFWPARDGSARIEISTDAGVALHERTLAGPSEAVGLPPLGELLAKRGEMRLVRATPATAVVLDRKGVRAYLPLAQLGAVLGERSIIAGSWNGSPGETARRVPIPDERYRKRLRVPLISGGLGVNAELRDLPPVTQLDASSAIAKVDAGKAAVGAIAIDPAEPAVYATALEKEPDDATSAGVARFDLKAKAWSWYRADGCGPGLPVGLAVSSELVACAARAAKGASVHATSRDGQPMWTWSGANADGLDAVGELVLVRDAARVHLLDARDGRLLGDFESDDGGAMAAAILDVDGMQMLVTAEHGRVIGRLPRADMIPAWTLAVNGVVKTIDPAGDGVLVALEDGDAYRVDARTGKAQGVAGIGLVWHSVGDVLAGEAPGGPIPPAEMPSAAPASQEQEAPADGSKEHAGTKESKQTAKKATAKKATAKKAAAKTVGRKETATKPAEVPDDDLGPPARLARDVWPDPGPLPASWQLTLYELSGVYRARNDYALDAPITPAVARGAKAPVVVQSGPGLREVLVVEPVHGDPVRRVRLPDDAAPGTAFSTMVEGTPVVGVLLANPLRVVMF